MITVIIIIAEDTENVYTEEEMDCPFFDTKKWNIRQQR